MQTRQKRGDRRGSALMLVLIFTVALGGLAASAIYLSSGGSILSKMYDRERDYRYAAEWALAVGKARLAKDTSIALPDSGYVTLMNDVPVTDAGGAALRRVKVDLYAGETGITSGQFGRYVSLVAVAYDTADANRRARHHR
jgi:hypothetical protein